MPWFKHATLGKCELADEQVDLLGRLGVPLEPYVEDEAPVAEVVAAEPMMPPAPPEAMTATTGTWDKEGWKKTLDVVLNQISAKDGSTAKGPRRPRKVGL